MKVKELTEALKDCDPEGTIMVYDEDNLKYLQTDFKILAFETLSAKENPIRSVEEIVLRAEIESH